MKMNTNAKAAGWHNHNESLVRAPQGLKVKTSVKRAGWLNHNETLLRTA